MTTEDSSTETTLADQNLIQSIREHAHWQKSCELVERDGLLLLAGWTSYPGAYRNCAVRLDPALSAAETLQRTRSFFGARERGFTLWVRTAQDGDLDAYAQSEGMQRVADGPCMLVTRPLPLPEIPEAVRVERFVEEGTVRDAVAINAEAYTALGLASEEVLATFPEPGRLLSDRVIGFVVYRDARPVATALTIIDGQTAGLYWVGTLARTQRTGLGGLCTRLATNAGFERGARVVMLQASPFGEPLYARLGYREYGRARWYRESNRA